MGSVHDYRPLPPRYILMYTTYQLGCDVEVDHCHCILVVIEDLSIRYVPHGVLPVDELNN